MEKNITRTSLIIVNILFDYKGEKVENEVEEK